MAILRFENEDEFIEKLKRKDEESFQILFGKLKDRFYRIARTVLGNKEDAEDVVSLTFERAYQSIKNFRKESSLYSWLYKILINSCYERIRKMRHQREKTDEFLQDVGVSSRGTEVRKGVDKALLRNTLSKLPKPYYEVFVLRVLEDMSYKEIAESLKIKEGTVMSRLHRSRIFLMKYLKKKKPLI